jgi:hypothetical protein
MYFIRHLSRTLRNKYHRRSNRWHNRIVNFDSQGIPKNITAITVYGNEKYCTDTEILPWPSVNPFEGDFKDNGVGKNVMASDMTLMTSLITCHLYDQFFKNIQHYNNVNFKKKPSRCCTFCKYYPTHIFRKSIAAQNFTTLQYHSASVAVNTNFRRLPRR